MTGDGRRRIGALFREEVAMIAVFVTFQYDEDFDRERMLGIAEHAKGTFAGMPELRLKAFTVDGGSKCARNVYLWESEDAARAFFSPELAERVTGLYGVPPRIEFAEVAELVDNATATVG
jgi:hypothetical protein